MTALTDAQRRTLHEGAQKAMGKNPADILLAGLPPQGWGDLATKTDVALVRADLEVGLAGVRVEMQTLRADLTSEIANVRAELGDKIATHTWIHAIATIGAVVSVSVIPRVLS